MFAAENGLKGDPRRQPISRAIRVVPGFPRPGLMFQDITTLLLDHRAFKDAVDVFVARYGDMDISVVQVKQYQNLMSWIMELTVSKFMWIVSSATMFTVAFAAHGACDLLD